jgi:hypothetical protein
MRIARHDYKVDLEKEGFIPVERMASNPLVPGTGPENAAAYADMNLGLALLDVTTWPATLIPKK